MHHTIEGRLGRFQAAGYGALLRNSKLGLEKESLRVDRNGTIAQTPHLSALGSALTNRFITTDYSEALLELITPPMDSVTSALDFLGNTQKFVYDRLEDETLWATSMPCVINGETSIPVAYYGDSNLGRMKTVYRHGLGYRYGKTMQVIAGVHFNYSLNDEFWQAFQSLEGDSGHLREFKDKHYFAMLRNLQRFGWLIPYLFGASPSVCRTFFGDKKVDMPMFDDTSYYEPFATSLRMGDIGYTNAKEGELGVKACYNSLQEYVEHLQRAIATPSPEYEKIGVVVNGIYRQLNANILQIENEYYSTVRPKQILQGLEKPTRALSQRGVQYVELRSLDVNAYEPLGIGTEQAHFIEAFMIFTLLHESPPIDKAEQKRIDWNQTTTAHEGRDPGLKLFAADKEILLRDWALEICEAMQGICELLDATSCHQPYQQALHYQREVILDADRTPSARMLAEMRANKEGFFDFAMRMSMMHKNYYANYPINPDTQSLLKAEVETSIDQQAKIEQQDDNDFAEYLQAYMRQ